MSNELKTVTPEAVKVGETVSGNKNGRDWTLWPIGIKIKGQWYNGAVFDESSLERFKTDQEITLEFYKDEQYGWKFKVPKDTDLLISQVKDLTERIEKLELLNQIP